MLETAERLTAEEREPALRLYLLVVAALRALADRAQDPSLVLDAFLLRAMALAGWAPALAECARCGAARAAPGLLGAGRRSGLRAVPAGRLGRPRAGTRSC